MVAEQIPMEEGAEPVIETSDATSSSEVVQKPPENNQNVSQEIKVEVESEAPEQQIDIEGCRQQLLQQQLLLQQIQLQHLQTTSIDEQVKFYQPSTQLKSDRHFHFNQKCIL